MLGRTAMDLHPKPGVGGESISMEPVVEIFWHPGLGLDSLSMHTHCLCLISLRLPQSLLIVSLDKNACSLGIC